MAGVGPEKVVLVCLRAHERLVVALIAILKAGGVYLPLDGDYPESASPSCTATPAPSGLSRRTSFGGRQRTSAAW